MNLRTLLAAAQIAMEAKARLPVILFVIQLLKQFDRSLVNAEDNNSSERTGQAGFVYVIRDKANGERYKSGYRARRPWRDSQLRKELAQTGDFVLIIPTKDASALEKRLRRAYAKGSRKGQWFTLNDGKRREILIIAALVQVVSGNDLGMTEVDPEIVQVATDVWNQLQSWAKVLWAKRQRTHQQPEEKDGASDYEPDLEEFSAVPEIDWEWESVLDEDYRDLPKATGKSVYVCIIRDNVAKRAKIYFHNHPVKCIEAAFAERSLQFPLEVVLVLKADNWRKVRNALLSPYERKKGNKWVELTQEELGEFRQSAKEDYVHGSLYVSPKSHWDLKTQDADNYKRFTKVKRPAGYVCVVQGVNPGRLYKIWETSHPKGLVDDRWQSRELNNLHDMFTARKPIKFHVILECKYAESFREFLQERYHKRRRHTGWFELDDTQLEEIRSMGK